MRDAYPDQAPPHPPPVVGGACPDVREMISIIIKIAENTPMITKAIIIFFFIAFNSIT
ncbi:MAG: hypothetical protein ACTSWN_08870 [Promethearchaeota archaeon]